MSSSRRFRYDCTLDGAAPASWNKARGEPASAVILGAASVLIDSFWQPARKSKQEKVKLQGKSSWMHDSSATQISEAARTLVLSQRLGGVSTEQSPWDGGLEHS